jgi:hypothetical protein
MKHLKHSEVYTFKLVSGEEITAKLIHYHSDDGVFEVVQPISMILGPQGLQMMPSLFSSNSDKNVYINTASIAMAAETREDVRAKYIEATTGIVTAPTKQIITG